MMVIAATAVTALAAPLSARQVPTKPSQLPSLAPPTPIGPPQSTYAECLRPDVAQNVANLKAAMAAPAQPGTSPPEPTEVQKRVAGCTFFKVTLASKMTIEDTEVPGVTSTISGQGSITFGLAPDDAMAGYDFTSGVQDLTAPIYWDRGSALITRPDCIVTTVELPYTLFAFWLGVTSTPVPRVGVRISPAGTELHNIATRCKDPLGKWHDLPPSQEAIFSPAWIRVHGEGKLKGPQSADQQELINYSNALGKGGTPAPPKVSQPTGDVLDMGNLMALANDPKKLADLQKLNPNNPADMAKLSQLMNGVVPNANAQLAAAQDNFMFKAPGECTTDSKAITTVCTSSRTAEKLKDRLGYGTIKMITEKTTITIEKVKAPPGSP
jgi:hypothetical protein